MYSIANKDYLSSLDDQKGPHKTKSSRSVTPRSMEQKKIEQSYTLQKKQLTFLIEDKFIYLKEEFLRRGWTAIDSKSKDYEFCFILDQNFNETYRLKATKSKFMQSFRG